MRKDWDLIIRDYITLPITLDKIAKKYNITRQGLIYHKNKDKDTNRDWDLLRENYLTKTLQRSQEKLINKASKRIYENDLDLVNEFEKMIQKSTEMVLNAHELGLKGKSIETMQNSISELTKTRNLLLGKSTMNINLKEDEKKFRIDRLSRLGDLV